MICPLFCALKSIEENALSVLIGLELAFLTWLRIHSFLVGNDTISAQRPNGNTK